MCECNEGPTIHIHLGIIILLFVCVVRFVYVLVLHYTSCLVVCCFVCVLVVAGSNPFVSTSRSSISRKSVPIPGHTTSRVQRERGTKNIVVYV